MNIVLTDRQKEIVRKLRISDAGANAAAFSNLANGRATLDDIDVLCNIVNDEFLMKGLLPSFEPNEYGIELEDLLDVINRPRVTRSEV